MRVILLILLNYKHFQEFSDFYAKAIGIFITKTKKTIIPVNLLPPL